jgi:hypothetical protein
MDDDEWSVVQTPKASLGGRGPLNPRLAPRPNRSTRIGSHPVGHLSLPPRANPRTLRTVPARRFDGVVSRIVAGVYHDRPLSLEGSVLYGGRYNPPGEFGALYCGLTTETCWAELERKHEGRLKRSAFRVVRVSVRLQRILDLTASAVTGARPDARR